MRFSPDLVDEIYEREMLSLRGHADLAHYEDRLSLYFSRPLLPFVNAILTETAVSGLLTVPVLRELCEEYASKELCPDDKLAEIMHVLEHDGYLGKQAGGFVFASRLLRDWWRKSHEEFYTRRG